MSFQLSGGSFSQGFHVTSHWRPKSSPSFPRPPSHAGQTQLLVKVKFNFLPILKCSLHNCTNKRFLQQGGKYAKKYKVWTDLLLHVGPAQMHPEHTVNNYNVEELQKKYKSGKFPKCTNNVDQYLLPLYVWVCDLWSVSVSMICVCVCDQCLIPVCVFVISVWYLCLCLGSVSDTCVNCWMRDDLPTPDSPTSTTYKI